MIHPQRLFAWGIMLFGMGIFLIDDFLYHDPVNKLLNSSFPLEALMIAFILIGVGAGTLVGSAKKKSSIGAKK